MSDSVYDGGPAFPTTCDNASERLLGMQMGIVSDGMTLRDYFAAKAMAALLNPSDGDSIERRFCDRVAVDSYKIATAMLKARGE